MKCKSVKFTVVFFLIFTMLFGGAPVTFAKKSQVSTPLAEWTIIQYHDADNDLGKYAIADLQEMMAVGSSDKVKLVVLYDTLEGPASSYYIVKGGTQKISDYGEVDMGNPAVLAAFIQEAMTNYPAKRYILNIWDHGDDFLGSCRDYHIGPGSEEVEHGFLLHSELLSAIAPYHFEIIAFDACIESMIEVAYDYKAKASYLIVSEDYVPYWGFPYDVILQHLETNPTADTAWVSKMWVDDYMAEYLKKNGNGGGGYVMAFPTLSAIKLSRVGSFVTEFDQFTSLLTDGMDGYKGTIDSARGKARLNMPIYGWDADIDLYTLVDHIGQDIDNPIVETAAEDVKSFWTGADPFIYTRCSDQYASKSANGIGVYFPASLGSLIHNTITDAEYYFGGSVPFASETNWGNFLRTYFDYWL